MNRESRKTRMTPASRAAVRDVLVGLFAEHDEVSWQMILDAVNGAAIPVDNWLTVRDILVNVPNVRRIPNIFRETYSTRSQP